MKPGSDSLQTLGQNGLAWVYWYIDKYKCTAGRMPFRESKSLEYNGPALVLGLAPEIIIPTQAVFILLIVVSFFKLDWEVLPDQITIFKDMEEWMWNITFAKRLLVRNDSIWILNIRYAKQNLNWNFHVSFESTVIYTYLEILFVQP